MTQRVAQVRLNLKKKLSMSSVEQICGLSESCREQETEKLSVYNITTSPLNGEANKHSEALSCHHLLHCGDLC